VGAGAFADFTNPFANSGSAGLQFVNADITLYLSRLAQGEWLGFEVTSHQADDGVAVAECAMYDEAGPIGRSVVCAVANRRR
jgi:acyl-CoA thioesterase